MRLRWPRGPTCTGMELARRRGGRARQPRMRAARTNDTSVQWRKPRGGTTWPVTPHSRRSSPWSSWGCSSKKRDAGTGGCYALRLGWTPRLRARLRPRRRQRRPCVPPRWPREPRASRPGTRRSCCGQPQLRSARAVRTSRPPKRGSGRQMPRTGTVHTPPRAPPRRRRPRPCWRGAPGDMCAMAAAVWSWRWTGVARARHACAHGVCRPTPPSQTRPTSWPFQRSGGPRRRPKPAVGRPSRRPASRLRLRLQRQSRRPAWRRMARKRARPSMVSRRKAPKPATRPCGASKPRARRRPTAVSSSGTPATRPPRGRLGTPTLSLRTTTCQGSTLMPTTRLLPSPAARSSRRRSRRRPTAKLLRASGRCGWGGPRSRCGARPWTSRRSLQTCGPCRRPPPARQRSGPRRRQPSGLRGRRLQRAGLRALRAEGMWARPGSKSSGCKARRTRPAATWPSSSATAAARAGCWRASSARRRRWAPRRRPLGRPSGLRTRRSNQRTPLQSRRTGTWTCAPTSSRRRSGSSTRSTRTSRSWRPSTPGCTPATSCGRRAARGGRQRCGPARPPRCWRY
mmetsp:Transcript_6795/g.20693  ORF Transcript_6795/g.20693 Transcript_6795/m.20693 type:complete len:569 (-) Transcript_6795:93-1799(-)